ncbi:SDR family NAD(P)-dependent oxidoreductase [Pollutimonas bauzanensis]|nr:SDR family NAD(P)-dependent oxidoreductase [Pollutimonas bauzanensis]
MAKKTVLITGAAGGIGRATAIRLANSGANLALSDIDMQALEKLRGELAASGADITCHRTDVSDSASCAQTAQEAGRHFGKIDHLVHSAGIYPQATVADMTDADWQQLMRINLDGTFHICRAVIPHLGPNSSIVNLASMAGHRGSHSHAHYSASKGAVSSFSKSLALELAPNTRVNIVAPGIIETAMTSDLLRQKGQALLDSTPLKRFGTADDVAGAIVFLCSDLAGFISGATIHVNGGLYIV